MGGHIQHASSSTDIGDEELAGDNAPDGEDADGDRDVTSASSITVPTIFPAESLAIATPLHIMSGFPIFYNVSRVFHREQFLSSASKILYQDYP